MPKRVGFLYDKGTDKDFIRKCIKVGLQCKTKDKQGVGPVKKNPEWYADKVWRTMVTRSYRPTKPREKVIIDKSSCKIRTISTQPFNTDGIYQTIAVEILKPILIKSLHHWSCGSIKGRGGKRMLSYTKRIIQNHPKNSKYVAELDIKQFYPSIPLKRLIAAYERRIKDQKFLIFLAILITSSPISLAEALREKLTPYDIVGDKVGTNIGSVLSVWNGNFYLEPVDRLILSLDGISYEARYSDNIVITSRNKKKLHKAIKMVNTFLQNKLGLVLKENWQVFCIEPKRAASQKSKKGIRRVSVVGYRIGRNDTILRQRNFLRIARQSRRIQKKLKSHSGIPPSMARSFLSRVGLLKHSDSQYTMKNYIKPAKVKLLKQIISKDDRRKKEDNHGNYQRRNKSTD